MYTGTNVHGTLGRLIHTEANVHGTLGGLMYMGANVHGTLGGLMYMGANEHGTLGVLMYTGLMYMLHRNKTIQPHFHPDFIKNNVSHLFTYNWIFKGWFIHLPLLHGISIFNAYNFNKRNCINGNCIMYIRFGKQFLVKEK